MDVPIPCVCPPVEGRSRHEAGDTVTIRDRLDFKSASAIRSSLAFGTSDDQAARTLELLALLTESYVMFGVESWTLVDEGGPVPVSHAAIRRFLLDGNVEAASLVAEVADQAYSDVVLLPLVNRASTSSPRTPTNGSTYRRTDSSRKRRTPSSRSSTRITPMGATGTTSGSPVGDSSSSPKPESVG